MSSTAREKQMGAAAWGRLDTELREMAEGMTGADLLGFAIKALTTGDHAPGEAAREPLFEALAALAAAACECPSASQTLNKADETIAECMTTAKVAEAQLEAATKRRRVEKVAAAQTGPADGPAPGDEERPAKKTCACGKGTPIFWCKIKTCVTCKAAGQCC